VRLRTVQFARRLLALGYYLRDVADRVGVKLRTLQHWMRTCSAPIPTLENATLEHVTLEDATLVHATLVHAASPKAPAHPTLAAETCSAVGRIGNPSYTTLAAALSHATSCVMLPPPTPPLPTLGRPLTPSSIEQQQTLFSWLDDVGPGVGLPTVRRHFDGMARAELDMLLKEYRRRWRAANPRLLHVLHWRCPGTVWAADFAEAPCLIDGRYPYLLAVRDLASGQQLLWQPVMALTAEVFLNELSLLIALHGAPWVLKTDNGSAFIADMVHWYLQRLGVYQLFSPPGTPEYNGAIEASIGSGKRRTQRFSELAGHPDLWTRLNLLSAQNEANTTARPRRLHGMTAQQVWDARPPLSSDERARFDASVAQFRIEACIVHGLSIEEPLTRSEQAAVDREALRRALVAHDLLWFRRRSIPPRITRPKVTSKG